VFNARLLSRTRASASPRSVSAASRNVTRRSDRRFSLALMGDFFLVPITLLCAVTICITNYVRSEKINLLVRDNALWCSGSEEILYNFILLFGFD
jgi:hypothetical protein